MSFAANTGSGSGGDGSKRGKEKSVHPVHTATSWRSNTKDESNNKLGESNQANTSAQTIASTTAAPAAPAAPTILPPRAPLPDYDFPQGCIKFAQHTAAYGRNQARRALHLAAIDRPDAWVTDLAKPIIHDANKRRGAFAKSAREEGRDNEIYRWADGDLNAVQLGLIANAPDEG